jgi:Exostosin family
MKIYLSSVQESECLSLLTERSRYSKVGHLLVDHAAEADLIVLLGNFGSDPELILQHPDYIAFPDKCSVYTEDDNYLPLLPGVYCSAEMDSSSRAGRTFSYAYISRNGLYTNPFVTDAQAVAKKYLFTFQGGSTSLLRKRLFNISFNRPDVLVENTSTYYHWDLTQPDRTNRQQVYAETLAASHFVLCPRGAGTGSIRLFEVMNAGVAPVLIGDNYLLPKHVDWDKFLLRIRERDIERLPQLLEPHLATSAERGRLAHEAFMANFAMEVEFDQIIALCSAAVHHRSPPEAIFRKQQAQMIARLRLKREMRTLAKSAALKAMKILHIKNPYQMNER